MAPGHRTYLVSARSPGDLESSRYGMGRSQPSHAVREEAWEKQIPALGTLGGRKQSDAFLVIASLVPFDTQRGRLQFDARDAQAALTRLPLCRSARPGCTNG